ncbi:hypothetical protein Q1695_007705 [Nippostrongylus brasiliensis]|nr:hypothetical protein Q1695_007705 [Nippostrongylus brasiliensis]
MKRATDQAAQIDQSDPFEDRHVRRQNRQKYHRSGDGALAINMFICLVSYVLVAEHNLDDNKLTTIIQYSALGMQQEIARGMKFAIAKVLAGNMKRFSISPSGNTSYWAKELDNPPSDPTKLFEDGD